MKYKRKVWNRKTSFSFSINYCQHIKVKETFYPIRKFARIANGQRYKCGVASSKKSDASNRLTSKIRMPRKNMRRAHKEMDQLTNDARVPSI
mmetsp:Transcript_25762/g.35875  ORF Transcript_25762/g.35875 Transcript_25762/m.35875 type:complete len:92 (+) Transcript_25762:152-427(+)